MKIIIPMAGRGSRLRPHTLTVPKPLIPIAGKPIVQRLAEDITQMVGEDLEEIAFIIGDFGEAVERDLLELAENLGAKGRIFHQEEPLGTGHAILCAAEALSGPVVVAFADTLFRADFTIDPSLDGVIWVKQVDDPSAFGVVQIAEDGTISDFVEKPTEFVSDLAIIGIYYFKSGENLRAELEYIIEHDIRDKGEYQLTTALEAMRKKGLKLYPGEVGDWMDCGNKDVTVETNQRVLDHLKGSPLIASSAVSENSTIIPPCFIGEGVVLKNCTIGPHVSIGAKTTIENSTISNSIIQKNSQIFNAELSNSMIGNHATYRGGSTSVSIGDFSVLE